jgi:hypothetical protein
MFALIATIVIVGSAAAVVWVIHSSSDPVDTATVYAGYLAAAATAVTLLTAVASWWRKGRQRPGAPGDTPEQAAAAADRLADLMLARWRQEAMGRRIITPAPATIRWRWADGEIAAPRAEVARVPAPGTGPLPAPSLGAAGELLGSGAVTRLGRPVSAAVGGSRSAGT